MLQSYRFEQPRYQKHKGLFRSSIVLVSKPGYESCCSPRAGLFLLKKAGDNDHRFPALTMRSSHEGLRDDTVLYKGAKYKRMGEEGGFSGKTKRVCLQRPATHPYILDTLFFQGVRKFLQKRSAFYSLQHGGISFLLANYSPPKLILLLILTN